MKEVSVNLRLVLIVGAIVLFILAALNQPIGDLGPEREIAAGLVLFAGAHL